MSTAGSLQKALRLLHTVRHLRPVQVFGRTWFRFHRPRPDTGKAPNLRGRTGPWVAPVCDPACMTGPSFFHLLNESRTVEGPWSWDDPAAARLWRYHLHYFDDLNAENAARRKSWHEALIRRWISENPPGTGTGWEPYPVSRRIVNWIKWQMAGNALSEEAVQSLAVQARWLEKRLEWHLLGNHLLANAKALFFAGAFFGGSEGDRWLKKGREIGKKQTAEQVLPDGGHFEGSPMYHALVLGDLLDLANLCRTYGLAVPEEWEEACGRMLDWLKVMTHPDGGIALFNDAAFGMAPSWKDLADYAERLGVRGRDKGPGPMAQLPDTGYVRCGNRSAVLFVDAGPVGPDYIPGHAHADTLGFEFSLFGQRLIVDSGTSTYEKTPERKRQRGTAAHNTVMIDGRDSSEVWGGFRVGRRARPFDVRAGEEDGALRVACSHDGYLRLSGSPVHRREYILEESCLRVRDRIRGGFETAAARFHFHPDVAFTMIEAGRGKGRLPGGEPFSIHVEKGVARLVGSTWHPEFGKSIPSLCLEVSLSGAVAEVVLSWNR